MPSTAKSLVLLCVDVDVPTRPDDVNKEGRLVRPTCRGPISGIGRWSTFRRPSVRFRRASPPTARLHAASATPAAPRDHAQGLNDYTLWFAGDKDMEGQYFGYDGPCPPWNDTLLHHYHFTLYATDLVRRPVEGAFTGQQVRDAIAQHVLAEARLTGTYALKPAVK